MTFAARYPGICSQCDEAIVPGQMIRFSDGPGSAEHGDCASAAPRERPAAEVCTTCFIERPCECDDQAPR